MANKEDLEKAFGKLGDFNPSAAAIFGSAYLDFPDNTQNIDPIFEKTAADLSLVVTEVGGLVDRALERAPVISCKENQLINARYIHGYITNIDEGITPEQIWSTFKHIESCHNKVCHTLHNISTYDNTLTRDQMNKAYGEYIDKWFRKNGHGS